MPDSTSRTDEQEMSQELLGVVSASAKDTLSTWGTVIGDGLVPDILSSFVLEARPPNQAHGCAGTIRGRGLYISFSTSVGADTIQGRELLKGGK